jgi:hypothetical protein
LGLNAPTPHRRRDFCAEGTFFALLLLLVSVIALFATFLPACDSPCAHAASLHPPRRIALHRVNQYSSALTIVWAD